MEKPKRPIILRYELPLYEKTIKVYEGFVPIDFGYRDNDLNPSVWGEAIDTGDEKFEDFEFTIAGTGITLREGFFDDFYHVKTLVHDSYVWHIYLKYNRNLISKFAVGEMSEVDVRAMNSAIYKLDHDETLKVYTAVYDTTLEFNHNGETLTLTLKEFFDKVKEATGRD